MACQSVVSAPMDSARDSAWCVVRRDGGVGGGFTASTRTMDGRTSLAPTPWARSTDAPFILDEETKRFGVPKGSIRVFIAQSDPGRFPDSWPPLSRGRLKPDQPARIAQISPRQLRPDSEPLAQARRASQQGLGGQWPCLAAPSKRPDHRLPVKHPGRADQYCSGVPLAQARNVEAVMHAVGEVHVRGPRHHPHGLIANCPRAVAGMGGLILRAGVCLGLDDAGSQHRPTAVPAAKVSAQQCPGNNGRRPSEEGTR